MTNSSFNNLINEIKKDQVSLVESAPARPSAHKPRSNPDLFWAINALGVVGVASVLVYSFCFHNKNEETRNYIVATETDNLRIRSGPGTEYAVIGYIAQGSCIKGSERPDKSEWIELRPLKETFSGQRPAYAYAKFLVETKISDTDCTKRNSLTLN